MGALVFASSECLCPACGVLNPTSLFTCEKCTAELKLDGRYYLHEVVNPVAAEIDDGGVLYKASDNKREVLIRIARHDDEGHLREEKILRGLKLSGVTSNIERFDFGHGSALVMSSPISSSLADLVETGFRLTSKSTRTLLRQALKLLAELEALSPPVHHRYLSSSTLLFDPSSVGLRDFARASSNNDDKRSKVRGALGFSPFKEVTAVQQDHYGLAAAVIHLLAHKEPSEMLSNGAKKTLLFESSVNIDIPLEKFLKALLKGEFSSSAEALVRLPLNTTEVVEKRSFPLALPMLAGGAFVLLFTIVAALVIFAQSDASADDPNVHAVSHSTRVSVTSFPPGAALFVDGKRVGKTPKHLRLPTNKKTTFKVTLGRKSQSRTITVKLSESLHFDLK